MKTMIERIEYLEQLKRFKDKDLIKVVTGIRRCGKSTLFELFINYLKESGIKDDQIININLGSPDYNFKDYMELYNYVNDKIKDNDMYYVFLDEVQNVPGFQKAVDSLYIKKNVAAEILSRAIKTTIGDIGKINLTLQEKFSTKFNKIVDIYNERTDIVDIEKIIEEMIKLKKEMEEEITNGNEYNLSSEEKAFFDALGADPEIKELMQDKVLVQIAKDLVELINENLTLDAFKRDDARARIRSNIRRLLIQYNYPPVKREGAVDKVIKQAELKYSNN